jgi:hypothetical protein
MKIISSRIPFGVFLLALLLCFFSVPLVWAEKDLIDEGKTDSAIKMLVFPKSLRVIENRKNEEASELFSDNKRIRKTLLKIDPARIAPAKAGEPVKGPVTRKSLQQLAHQYKEDVIFIFRRTFNEEKNSIRHQGLLYLARQKKILALKESVGTGFGSVQEMDLAGLKTLAKEARKVLHSHKFEKRQSAY